MNKNGRYLLVFYGTFLVDLLLIETKGAGITVLGKKRVRVYTYTYNFSPENYLLEVISLWGKELGIELVEEMVPIIPKKGKNGLDDIFVFTARKNANLNTITEKVLHFGDEFTQKGAKKVLDFINFKDLLFVCFDFDRTTVARYRKDSEESLKVVVEQKDFKTSSLASNKNFLQRVDFFKSIDKNLKNIFLNQIKLPTFEISNKGNVLIEYLMTNHVLEPFVECKKLQLDSFGRGEREENLIVISGERVLAKNNTPTFLLSVLEKFQLKGVFGVCFDQNKLFDYLQRSSRLTLPDNIYTSFLLDYWGSVLTIDRKGRKIKLGEEVADVLIKDGEGERQMIPMLGKILNFSFYEEGKIEVDLYENAVIRSKEKKQIFENMTGNFIIDCRVEPRENNFLQKSETDVVQSWLSGIGAI